LHKVEIILTTISLHREGLFETLDSHCVSIFRIAGFWRSYSSFDLLLELSLSILQRHVLLLQFGSIPFMLFNLLRLLFQNLLVLFTLLQERLILILELGDFQLLIINLLLELSNLLLVLFKEGLTQSKNLRLIFIIIHLI